jgi:hypothetical protein
MLPGLGKNGQVAAAGAAGMVAAVAEIAVVAVVVVAVAANAVSVGQDGIEPFSFTGMRWRMIRRSYVCWSTHPIEPNSTRTILDGDVSAPVARVTAYRHLLQ